VVTADYKQLGNNSPGDSTDVCDTPWWNDDLTGESATANWWPDDTRCEAHFVSFVSVQNNHLVQMYSNNNILLLLMGQHHHHVIAAALWPPGLEIASDTEVWHQVVSTAMLHWGVCH